VKLFTTISFNWRL